MTSSVDDQFGFDRNGFPFPASYTDFLVKLMIQHLPQHKGLALSRSDSLSNPCQNNSHIKENTTLKPERRADVSWEMIPNSEPGYKWTMKNKISYETKIQDGRCRGLGRDYRPWFQIHEKDRPGIGMRFMWKKTGRMHEIIGRNRINFFYDLLWDDSVTNVMESYVDLTREKTAEFAVNHHLHPLFTGGGEFDVFVTDFLITYADGTQKAVDIIKPGTLNSPPMLNRHKVKEAYWKERGIPFETIKISDPQQRQRRANMIQHLLQPLPDVPNAYEPVVLTAFLSDYNQTDMSIMEIARKVEKAFLLSFGDGVLPFWYLASHKRIILNPEEPIIFSRKRGEKQLMSTWPFSDNSGTFCHSDLLENSCFSMSDKTVWRIIHVSQSVIHMIEITDSIRLPVAIDTDTFKKHLQNGEYILTCSDPFHVPSRITDSMLRKQHLWEKSLSAFPVKQK